MLLQYSKKNGLVNPNVINPKRYFHHCQETPPSWLEVLLTLHVYRGVTLFHSACRSTKETPTQPGDYHKSLQNQHSEKEQFEKLIDLSCVSGFLQHLIFIKDQACWLTHGAIFPFVPFFLLTFDWVVSNERRTVCAGKCHSSPGGTPLYKPYRYVTATSKGRVFAPLWSENGYRLSSIWSGIKNRVWFSRELRECTKVFIVSIPNEQQRKRNMPIRNGF